MDKPYPWTCGYCATKTVQPVIRDWSLKVRRGDVLHDVHLKAVEMPTCSTCGSEWTNIYHSDKIEEELKRMGVTDE